jgi:hypothetical protein
MHKLEVKAPFGECAKGSHADWAEHGERLADWARVQMRFKYEMIFEFQGILEFGKTLRNSTRRFRTNLDMGIFF